jgi:hypothetical protein
VEGNKDDVLTTLKPSFIFACSRKHSELPSVKPVSGRRALPIRVIRVISGELLLRREEGDDFFEVWIAVQRILPDSGIR